MMKWPIIALDFSTKQEVHHFLSAFSHPLFVKVGMELYLQHGPGIIAELKDQGHWIFLDLKLHDIPTTVRKAMHGLGSLEVDLVNVHAAGGEKMMAEAKEGLLRGAPSGKTPKLIAVTQLTSTSEEQMRREQLIGATLHESVLHYAALADRAGLDGVVCSPHEAKAIEKVTRPSFERITPGIRLAGETAHDQIRIATPRSAKEMGSTGIVVGRAVTQSETPEQTYNEIVSQWGEPLNETANR